MADMHEWVIAFILGGGEGLTEFLPVSSTGQMILVGSLLGFTDDKAKTFEVIIQLGSILAVVVVFWRRLFGLIGIHFGEVPHEGIDSKIKGLFYNVILLMLKFKAPFLSPFWDFVNLH